MKLILLLVAAGCQAQSIHELYGTDTFHRAYVEAGEITFEPFQQLDWEAQARKALSWLSLDHPTPEQIARLATFEPAGPQFRSVDFHAPLDAAVRRNVYLLIQDGGVVAIQPVQLRGSVDYNFDPGFTTVRERHVSGRIVGKPARPATDAAFVVIGTPADVRDVVPGAKFAKGKQAGPPVYEFRGGGAPVTWTPPPAEHPDPASALSFQLGGERLLLVRWKSDDCGAAYTLFSVASTLKPIAGNNYACDP